MGKIIRKINSRQFDGIVTSNGSYSTGLRKLCSGVNQRSQGTPPTWYGTYANNKDIVIRKADKANIFVILNRTDYKRKLDVILNDTNKFKRISKNPTNELKIKVNKLIGRANHGKENKVLTPIIGEFKPGYLYGNVKTYKNGNPVRPIISQIPTPTYGVAKQLNRLITPYLPNRYMINSTDEFLSILKTTTPDGLIASLDAESLFTNVPIKETIEIICDAAYNHDEIPAPPFSRKILRELLEACTMEAPFRDIDGKLYLQIDGVAMGSPLGVTFANYYMCHVENKTVDEFKDKIKTYTRYVDDCYLVIKDVETLENFRKQMEKNSVLKFTYETSIDQNLNFLDLHIDGSSGQYITSVYKKPTNNGTYLNAKSECPEMYKIGTVRALIHRAYKNSSNWNLFQKAIDNIKQSLINNGYSNSLFDKILKTYLEKVNKMNTIDNTITHTIFYKNQYTNNYKMDERVLKSIVRNNVKCTKENEKLRILIYYKNLKTTNLIMKNNMNTETDDLRKTNVIYEYTCRIGECELQNDNKYIGFTTTTLSRRITMHLVAGAPKLHTETEHGEKLTREKMTNNIEIIYSNDNFIELQIMESILIKKYSPSINRQDTGKAKKLFLLGSS